MGSVSAAITTIEDIPLFKVLVAAESESMSEQAQRRRNGARQVFRNEPCRTFIRAFLELLIVDSLLNNVQDSVGELQVPH